MKSFPQRLLTLLLYLSITRFSTLAKFHRQLIEGVPPLLFQGTLLNDLQSPIPNAYVQFWQTDPDGVYNHPGASGSNSLHPSFQYCGTATTDDDGTFWFLTHRPGAYANRPTHFHYKVWVDGVEMLTSQFYFADENTRYSDMQVIELMEHEFDNGVLGYVTNKTIVLDMNLGGDGLFTPSDMEGPFYPLFDFFDYGNDLINMTFTTKIDSDVQTFIPSVQPTIMTDSQMIPSVGTNQSTVVSLAPPMQVATDEANMPQTTAVSPSSNITTIADDEETMSTTAGKEQSSSRRLDAQGIKILSLIVGASMLWF